MRSMPIFILALSTTAFVEAAYAIEPVSFHTPSKNIYCYGYVEGANTTIDCELLTKTNTVPLKPRPGDCELEWGNRFALNNEGKADMVCAGDTVRSDTATVLSYGQRLDYYGIACTATKSGLECINDDAHGFKISKGNQEIY